MADAPKGSITGGQSWPLLRRIIVLYGLVSAAVQDRELMFDELLEQALDDDEIKAPAESAGVPAAELTEKAREGRQTIEGSSISESSLVSTAELAVRRTRVRVQLFVGLFGLVALAAGVLLTYDQVRGWLLVGASIAFLVAGLVVGLVTAAALAPVGWLTVRDELESAYG